MVEQSNLFRPITFPARFLLKVSIFTVNMQRPFTGNLSLPVTSVWVLHIYGKMGVLYIYGTFFTVNTQHLKNYRSKTGKFELLFANRKAIFSGISVNSQI